jgi:hypothetical protein
LKEEALFWLRKSPEIQVLLTEGPELVACGSSNSRAFRALAKPVFLNGDFQTPVKRYAFHSAFKIQHSTLALKVLIQ